MKNSTIGNNFQNNIVSGEFDNITVGNNVKNNFFSSESGITKIEENLPPEENKMLAILFSDIVGSTNIMDKNEQRAFEIIETNLEIHGRIIKKFNGRILKEIGDGILAIFPLVSDSVKSALEIQNECRKDNAYQLRIGIHSGEVKMTSNGKDIFGSSVNIAQRIQSMAAPDSIFISQDVLNNSHNKVKFECKLVGEKELRGIQRTMNLYEISLPFNAISIDILTIIKKSNLDVIRQLKNSNCTNILLTNQELKDIQIILVRSKSMKMIKLTSNGNMFQNRPDGLMRVGFLLETLENFVLPEL